jgi:hypothetical protein
MGGLSCRKLIFPSSSKDWSSPFLSMMMLYWRWPDGHILFTVYLWENGDANPEKIGDNKMECKFQVRHLV